MLNSAQLKKIVTEARPLIERQLDLAEQIAGLRDVVSAAGGDWGQLKALVKAQIQDERDDASDGKRVRKILDKADYAKGYADMLGLANMNEENFFEDDNPPHDDDGVILETIPGNNAEAAENEVEVALVAASSAQPISSQAGSSVPVRQPSSAGTEGEADRQPTPDVGSDADEQASGVGPCMGADVTTIPEPAVSCPADPLRSEAATRKDAETPAQEPTNIVPIRTHNPETHFLNSKGLLRLHGSNKPEACAGSFKALCFGCSVKHDGPSPMGGVA